LTAISPLLVSPGPPTARAGDPPPGPAIHQVTASLQGLSVNGDLVEGRRSVVAMDSVLTVSDSKALSARLDAIGKPLVAVLIAHEHPDHCSGVSYLTEGKTAPVNATAAVTKVIRDWDERKERQWKPVFKEEWPPHSVPGREDEVGLPGCGQRVHDRPRRGHGRRRAREGACQQVTRPRPGLAERAGAPAPDRLSRPSPREEPEGRS
jgi:glyoxylase-like metal-dependent hydrolase (beta-lactamase superfamily II)